MNQISAVVITYNEEDKIERALLSLQKVSDEIVVVDSYSSDATPQICYRYTDRFIQRSWEGYRVQKQFATEQASHEWILNLDADEMLSPDLTQEILHWKNERSTYSGYLLPRKTFFMGKWITHTTWYPDCQLRLFRRSSGSWKGGRVHESFRVDGPTGRLNGEIYHYTYSSFSEYLQQLENFSSLAAQDYFDRGKKVTWFQICFDPAAIFLKNYFFRLGFMDGIPGLCVSMLASVSTLFKYLKLWELQSNVEPYLPGRTLR